MNKRTISRCGALLTSIAFVASSFAGNVSAAGKYDLAKYVDEFNMQTIGYKAASTSDGGYIVGGKALACVKYIGGGPKEYRAASVSNDYSYEFTDFVNCLITDDGGEAHVRDGKAVSNPGNLAEVSVLDYCGDYSLKDELEAEAENGVAKAELVDDSDEEAFFYQFRCLDYMAKYDKNGKGLWMTPIEDSSNIIAVGETDSDYRMLVDSGALYLFEKADGDSDFFNIDFPARSVKFNKNGTMVVYGDGLSLYSKTGQWIRDYKNADLKFSTITVSGDELIVGAVEHDDNDNETSVILSISNDLKTTKTRLSSKTDYLMPLSGTKDGDMIIIREMYDEESDTESYVFESYDKNNKKLGSLALDPDGELFLFIDGYAATNNKDLIMNRMMNGGLGAGEEEDAKNKSYLALYSRDLKEIGRVETTDSELVNDVTILNNGTLVTAGGVLGNDNDNGLRIHLAAKTSDKPTDVDNPNTGDNVTTIAMIGGAALLGSVFLISKKFARR